MRTRGWLAAAAVSFVFGHALAASAKDEAGIRVPEEVLRFARETRAGGLFEMQLDERGTVLGLETEIPLDAVPKVCRDAAEKTVPGSKQVGAEREWVQGTAYFEVVCEAAGVRHEVLMREDGTVVGREEIVAKPTQAVLDAAEKAVPGGKLEVVEHVTGPEAGGGSEFHVKKTVDGEMLRISVSEDGKPGRVVRKVRAEVRVPK